jgi:hypothetical protein
MIIESKLPKILIGLVLFDTLATYILWTNGLMVEENPLMLRALEVGWLYWLIKALQVALATLLGVWYTKTRVARVAVLILALVFSVAWLQFLIGSLV